jgi:hypothetical protein
LSVAQKNNSAQQSVLDIRPTLCTRTLRLRSGQAAGFAALKWLYATPISNCAAPRGGIGSAQTLVGRFITMNNERPAVL